MIAEIGEKFINIIEKYFFLFLHKCIISYISIEHKVMSYYNLIYFFTFLFP